MSAADIREAAKPLLADIVNLALGHNNMSGDVMDQLLQRSDILKELYAFASTKDKNTTSRMDAFQSLLVSLGKARFDKLICNSTARHAFTGARQVINVEQTSSLNLPLMRDMLKPGQGKKIGQENSCTTLLFEYIFLMEIIQF